MYLFGNLKAGFLNAWLGVLLIFLASWTILATDKKARRRLSNTSWCSPREKKLVWSGTFLLFVILVFSIFVPLQLNTNWFYIDPILSLIIIIFVLKEGYTIFREVVHILMQGTPIDIDLSQIKSRLESIPGVENIHHIHVWSLNEKEYFTEFHVTVNCQTFNEMDQLRDRINSILTDEFHINHTTIQFEGKKCETLNI